MTNISAFWISLEIDHCKFCLEWNFIHTATIWMIFWSMGRTWRIEQAWGTIDITVFKLANGKQHALSSMIQYWSYSNVRESIGFQFANRFIIFPSSDQACKYGKKSWRTIIQIDKMYNFSSNIYPLFLSRWCIWPWTSQASHTWCYHITCCTLSSLEGKSRAICVFS
jgi:hypothetical protein